MSSCCCKAAAPVHHSNTHMPTHTAPVGADLQTLSSKTPEPQFLPRALKLRAILLICLQVEMDQSAAQNVAKTAHTALILASFIMISVCFPQKYLCLQGNEGTESGSFSRFTALRSLPTGLCCKIMNEMSLALCYHKSPLL